MPITDRQYSHIEFEGSLSKVPNNILPVKTHHHAQLGLLCDFINRANKSKVLHTIRLTDIRAENVSLIALGCPTGSPGLPAKVTTLPCFVF